MRHGIDLKPIHNIKDARAIPSLLGPNCFGPDLVSVTGESPQAGSLLRKSAPRTANLVERIGIEPMTSSLQS